ncbi:hypothetical protein G5714_019256 [Onychostoma macrolepis]|uniref:Uncharacterized protein n=1 Tax=Onychostoma macrolepis TaxID=369639 RepID=A0A7J6BVY2_9TELE|nr:hypothetical protein G5714_019256 [Onychostoma macrolepis]
MPPGKPTDERIAVEYLLAQSDRGDLLSPLEHSEITPPETQVEVQEDECLDVTICDAADINLDAHTLNSSSSHDSLISSLSLADQGLSHYASEKLSRDLARHFSCT